MSKPTFITRLALVSILLLLLALLPSFAPQARTTLAAVPLDVIRDGSFELGTPNAAWEEGSIHLGTPICDVASCGDGRGTAGPRSGTYWAWFGGLNEVESAFVAQPVRLFSAPATLRFWLWVGAASGTGNDVFEVSVDGTRVFSITDADRADYDPYTEVSIDLSAYADGSTHLLRFSGSVFGGGITSGV